MGNLAGFDATEVPEDTGFEALPKADYPGIAVESEMKPTKAGTGEYLQVVFEVLDGQYKGRKLWRRMNIKNPNSTAQDIGQRELAELCKACGIPRPQDSSELHNIPVMLSVDTELDDRRREVNVVKRVSPIGERGAEQSEQRDTGSARRETPPPRSSSGGDAGGSPWSRRK